MEKAASLRLYNRIPEVVPTTDVSWTGMSYGAVEEFLATLQETTSDAVRTRFRKLRQRPFPDDIRAGAGIRVAYDLPRVLALAVVFELNRLYVPQGHAVEMVQNLWPEVCRAAIWAAAEAKLLPLVAAVADHASSLLDIAADAFSSPDPGPNAMLVVTSAESRKMLLSAPTITIDLRRIVLSLAATVSDKHDKGLQTAFGDLERAFGWTAPATPHRSAVADMSQGRGFLDEGPYFQRARALLSTPRANLTLAGRPATKARMQWLLAYLEDPSPIDRWKMEIGPREDQPRLKHLLNAWSVEQGLDVRDEYPELMKVVGSSDPGALALTYIAEAETVSPHP